MIEISETINRRFTSHKDVELKNELRNQIAAQTAEYEAIHGKVQLTPIIVRDLKPNINPHNDRVNAKAKDKITQIQSGEDLMRMSEIAKLANINQSTLDNWFKQGKFIAMYKKVKCVRYFKREDVVAFIEKVKTNKKEARWWIK